MSLMVVQDNIIKDIADATREALNLPSEGIIGYNTVTTTGIVTKKAGSSNINLETGESNGGYADSVNRTDVVTIPGATGLNIEVTYQTEGTNYDYLTIYRGTVAAAAAVVAGSLGGTTKTTANYTIDGDSVCFKFVTDDTSHNYYGWYAVVTSVNELETEQEVPIYGPINQMYPYEIPQMISEFSPANEQVVVNFTSSSGSVTLPVEYDKIAFIAFRGSGGSNSTSRAFFWTKGSGKIIETTNYIYLPLITMGGQGTGTNTSWSYSGTSWVNNDGNLSRKNYSSSYTMSWWYLGISKSNKKSAYLYYTSSTTTPHTSSNLSSLSSYMVTSGDIMILGVK